MSKGNKKVEDILKLFKKSCISFLDELIDQFPEESDLVVARVVFEDQSIVDIINAFSQHILPHKEMIKKRNENFFLQESSMFNMIEDKNKVIHFKKLWTSNKLDKEDREAVWKWLDHFCVIVEAYNKIK